MTFLRRRETSRISSRGKGPVYNTGGGGSRRILTSSHKPISSSSIIISKKLSSDEESLLSSSLASALAGSLSSASCTALSTGPNCCRTSSFTTCTTVTIDDESGHGTTLTAPKNNAAACMIIDSRWPTLRLSDCNNDRTTASPTDRLLLLKHRTAKFSSNRHRKLQPFRET